MIGARRAWTEDAAINYYEHHIRDYDTATAHLTWEQDLAYRRLIAWYYRKEAPIPGDIKEACRQVRAVTKPQRDAVATVLAEFFDLADDGWHNGTCDEVIAAFHAGEPEREAKKRNEDTRLAKHRAERSELFGIINAAGIHLPWNTKMEELRTVADRVRYGRPETPATAPETKTATPATQPATAPATPATATQTPIPNTQKVNLTPNKRRQRRYPCQPRNLPRRRRRDSIREPSPSARSCESSRRTEASAARSTPSTRRCCDG
jgi:uncharacterized protein YdaU (DUF1376 family)